MCPLDGAAEPRLLPLGLCVQLRPSCTELLRMGPGKWETSWHGEGTEIVREASAWLSAVGPVLEMRNMKSLLGIIYVA